MGVINLSPPQRSAPLTSCTFQYHSKRGTRRTGQTPNDRAAVGGNPWRIDTARPASDGVDDSVGGALVLRYLNRDLMTDQNCVSNTGFDLMCLTSSL